MEGLRLVGRCGIFLLSDRDWSVDAHLGVHAAHEHAGGLPTHVRRAHAMFGAVRRVRACAKRVCSHDGPFGRRKRGYILMMDQSDAGRAGIFS
eukprot:358116-Pyramimonas_sp.AAC.1